MRELFSGEGKRVVVTGGTDGIGYTIAERLLKTGAELFLASRTADSRDEAARSLGQLGPVHAFARDLSRESERRLLADQIAEHTDSLHILVNVAGVFNMTRHLRPLLDRAAAPGDPARVINLSAIEAGTVPISPDVAHPAWVAAASDLTVQLSAELAPRIAVNAIAAEPVASTKKNGGIDEHEVESRYRTRLCCIGEPDIAGTVVYLASRAASHLTGAILRVDAGAEHNGRGQRPGPSDWSREQ